MDCVENIISNSSSIVAYGLVMGTCLFQGHYLVMGLHATVFINFVVSKVNISVLQAMEAHRVVRG
jgi:hypothetical protein